MDIMKLDISSEFLPTAGDSLADLLEERNLSLGELAHMLGRPDSYVAQVIAGHAPISEELAEDLERSLGVDASFWLELQANCHALLAKLNEEDRIDNHERAVCCELKDVGILSFLDAQQWPKMKVRLPDDAIIAMREGLNVSSLGSLENVAAEGAFRIADAETNPYVMGAWILIAKRISDREVFRRVPKGAAS